MTDPNSRQIAEQTIPYNLTDALPGDSRLHDLADVALWNAEQPNLYTVSVIQRDGKNGYKEEMAFSTKHGFRDMRIDGSLLYISGGGDAQRREPRHDSDPFTAVPCAPNRCFAT